MTYDVTIHDDTISHYNMTALTYTMKSLTPPSLCHLVALENGMDLTAQVVSLAQILLDPYYRTMTGFQRLIQKEWIAMGYKFSARADITVPNRTNEVLYYDIITPLIFYDVTAPLL